MDWLIVDNFAGGGGASTGIEAALGRSVDVAINHDAEAVAMHRANHSGTRHHCQSIMAIDPQEACTVDGRVRPVLLAWFSPDCKHFSKAKGGKPVEKRIRDLAWIVVHWAKRLGENRPQVIMLENVEEFRTWGPLGDDNRPCPDRKGQTFEEWVRQLRRLGYKVEWRELRACDYGAPTSRKRLFLIARRDGKSIVWPEPTHGPGRPRPWRTAAEIIDWSQPCPSIFERARPLKANTCRRIAAGIVRYVLDAADPFIVPLTHHGAADRSYPVGEPIPTITAAHRGEMAVVAPTLIQTGYGERDGQAPRVPGLDKPLGTIVAGGGKHALVAAHVMTMRNSGKPHTAIDEPTHTITAGGAHQYLVAAFMAQHNGGNGAAPRSMADPVSTLTARCTQQQLVTSNLIKLRGTSTAQASDEPLHTISAGGTHFAEVRAFLIKYYGNEVDGHGLDRPLGTVTTRDRYGLVTVSIDGEEYALADIGMRMLTARELFNAQGFPPDYRIDCPGPNGKPLTKTAQVRMCGNSVSPVIPEALVRANLPEHCAAIESAAA
ncbi:DNA cytosine methyltransferase [Croceicoccus sp. BE223]|uniref:DNA cytosine methyltransferase n=1 Tax=Croceicoccus sp. BE223 TaxID=2817716 RepID=UPI00286C12A6|nr:DNA cytosine methyltransferase [Croceicoccus sp. BE223]